ncbi:MAG: PEP-CTERM sorting domain-containing protein, partial [Akkermansiaceae bacterium]
IDRSQVSYQFLDGSTTLIGAAVTFDDGAVSKPNGTWTEYTDSGAVPTNAASVVITIADSAAAGSAGSNDGYADLVSFSTTAVPEPSSTALLGLGGLALIMRRRK